MKQKEVLKQAETILKKANIQDSYFKASILLQYVLNQTKQQLIVNSEEYVNDQKIIEYKKYINKIVNGIPVQYITHKQQFMGLEFYVDENVLIPQPDTEILVEETINIINNKKIKVLDLCTGSGAIAVSIAHYCPNVQVTATDISTKALEIAKINCRQLHNDIVFIQSDLFDKIKEKFNVIVSNPPYIETHTINSLSKEVQAEPYIALNGGKDGLEFYKKILNCAHTYLEPGGYLLLEIGYNQAKQIMNLESINLKLITKEPIKDLGQNDRVVIFQKEE